MKRLIPLVLVTVISAFVTINGCNQDQTTNVTVGDGDGTGGTVITRVDTVYIDDCPPCIPDTIYADDCPDCPECPDCPDCPLVDDSPYEGVFYITGMSAADVSESCSYSWIATNFQTVTIAEGMVCFAGWMIEWNETSHSGLEEFTEHIEQDGIFQDTTVRFELKFSGTDNLTATLAFHVEAGYVGYQASYFCDDQFTVTAERATVTESAYPGRLNSRRMTMPGITVGDLEK